MRNFLTSGAFIVFTLIFAGSAFAGPLERRAALLAQADTDNDGDVDANDAVLVDDGVDSVAVVNTSPTVVTTGTTVNAVGATTNVNAARTTANVNASGARVRAGGENAHVRANGTAHVNSAAGSPEGRRNVNQAQRSNNNTAARAGAHSRR